MLLLNVQAKMITITIWYFLELNLHTFSMPYAVQYLNTVSVHCLAVLLILQVVADSRK